MCDVLVLSRVCNVVVQLSPDVAVVIWCTMILGVEITPDTTIVPCDGTTSALMMTVRRKIGHVHELLAHVFIHTLVFAEHNA